MFERFRGEYGSRRDDSGGAPWHVDRLIGASGYAEFADDFAGASFGGGLYRVHDGASGPRAMASISEAFPELADRACPFGYDWLGRQFALDARRLAGDQPLVLLVEPGTGQALEIPATFVGFHEEELIEFADAALAREFFDSWTSEHRDSLPLDRAACVGYRVPLFLGGHDVVENLEPSDLDTYWTICGQLRQGVRDLPPGTTINEVSRR